MEEKQKDRMMEVSEGLLDMIGQAVQELKFKEVKEVTKEKKMFYDENESSRKATREVTREVETLSRVEGLVDRSGVKLLTGCLKDLQEVMRQQGGESEQGNTLRVILEKELDEYAC